jgi:hypothetical protein
MFIMRKEQVKNKEEVTKEMGQLPHKKKTEWKIKNLKTFGLRLDCLHEIVGVYFESFIRLKSN